MEITPGRLTELREMVERTRGNVKFDPPMVLRLLELDRLTELREIAVRARGNVKFDPPTVADLLNRIEELEVETDARKEVSHKRRDLKLIEVGGLTGLSRSTLYRKLREGTLRGRIISNGTWRIPYSEVERVLAGADPKTRIRSLHDRISALLGRAGDR